MHQFEYALIRLALALSRILPVSLIRALSCAFGRLYFAVDRRRRQLTLANLEIAFPDRPLSERRQLARGAYRHFALVIADMLLLMTNRLDVGAIEAAVDFSELDKHPLLAKDASGGLIVVSAHLGNWELMTNLCARRFPWPVAIVTRKLDNPLLEDNVIMPMRTRHGAGVIHKHKAMFGTMRILKNGGGVGLMLDQKTNAKQGVSVPFFGREAYSIPSAAALQVKFGYSAVGLFLVREADGYKFVVSEAIEPPDSALPEEERIRELTARHQAVIEDAIRQHPEQWFWMHDRWRLKNRRP